jgi:glycosyltransferase involved in cell wall biosynthesis
VGFLARIAPEKGLHVLAEAYRLLRQSKDVGQTRLEVAGYIAPEHKSYLSDIEQRLKDWGLASEFHYRGVLDRPQKIAFLRTLDVLSVPATYDEPKGVSLLEAMACGVPVVQPRRGAFTEIVERTSGGLLVKPDDPDSLAEGILKIFQNRSLAEELGHNGIRGVREHYSAAQMADRALEAYASVLSQEK